MSETTIAGGAITNWLAIIGVVSLIYWAVRLTVALMKRSGENAEPREGKSAAISTPGAAVAGGGAGAWDRHRRHSRCGLRCAGRSSHRAS